MICNNIQSTSSGHMALTGICVFKLSVGSVAIVMDFSEKRCVFQSEVQSRFFDRNQITMHAVICYYIEKQEDKEFKIKHVIIGIYK